MKTIHIKIADSLYSQLKKVLKLFPKDSYEILEEDSDSLTLEESKEVYHLKKQTDNNDFSEFDDSDNINLNDLELKLNLIELINSLKSGEIKTFYGIIKNHLNSEKENSWDLLSEVEKEGIQAAIDELDSGKGVSHDSIMNKYRKKFSNA